MGDAHAGLLGLGISVKGLMDARQRSSPSEAVSGAEDLRKARGRDALPALDRSLTTSKKAPERRSAVGAITSFDFGCGIGS